MQVIRTVQEIRNAIKHLNSSPLGFVPTMGALHAGHLSLAERAVSECRVTVVSIFVNPTQFNDKEDLKNYPRTEEEDIRMLAGVLGKNDVVFIPAAEEIYPEEDKRIFDFGTLTEVMEGIHRPGHFNGVAQVVSRLFSIVEPDIAYFGQKDFQQLAVINALVKQTGDKVKISGCPIIRESDGLAMSSRNRLLEPDIRNRAGVICQTIRRAAEMARDKEIEEIKDFVTRSINGMPRFSLEYFEIADDTGLRPVKSVKEFITGKRYFCFIAVWAGKIRLIDNIEISLP